VNGQADRLRGLKLVEGGRKPTPSRHAFTVAISSGKGGVGKTTIAANMAVELAALGKRVLLVDADLSLANADLLLGVHPEVRVNDVLEGRAGLEDALVAGPEGLTLLPAAGGLERLADLDHPTRVQFFWSLSQLSRRYEFVIIDTGSGISRDVIDLAASVDLSLVVITPEPTSLADGYAMVKILASRHPEAVALVINRIPSVAVGRRVARHLQSVSERFLSVKPAVFGWVEDDALVGSAVLNLSTLRDHAPHSVARRALRAMARKLLSLGSSAPHGQGFVSRLEASIRESISQ